MSLDRPFSEELTDAAFDALDKAARERHEVPQFRWEDVQAATAAILRRLAQEAGTVYDYQLFPLADEVERG
jgi:hypothetical protein